IGLCQPMRKSHLGPAPLLVEDVQHRIEIALTEEEVQVLRVSLDPGEPLQGVCPTDQEGDSARIQGGERPHVELADFWARAPEAFRLVRHRMLQMKSGCSMPESGSPGDQINSSSDAMGRAPSPWELIRSS